ncbi:hypothetical protein [Shewanella surugensis]|uniref:Uncharacterized protein n=1 Tax=Shewanella surugensis TaxID=212020 RepID=A0ABT0L6G5_9GAMM|nr:hypothetical protein [Shewanella surugensis]MCL1122980.1 hypothetical protein [Shewanella surugensis]
MRYKISFLLFILMPFSLCAASWPYSEKVLLKELDDAYAKVEERANFCSDLRSRKITKINSDWLLTLSEHQRQIALFAVSNMALDRCMKQVEGDYNTALINYTSKTGDKTKFDRWMILNSNYPKEIQADFNKLDQNELIKLSKQAELSIPFYPKVDKSIILPNGDDNSPFIYKNND